MSAREAHADHEYKDVKSDPRFFEEMLKLSGGQRRVPLIVSGGKVTIGHGGT